MLPPDATARSASGEPSPRITTASLVEDVVDDIDDLPGGVRDKQRIVVDANPLRARRRRAQAVGCGRVEPVILRPEQAGQGQTRVPLPGIIATRPLIGTQPIAMTRQMTVERRPWTRGSGPARPGRWWSHARRRASTRTRTWPITRRRRTGTDRLVHPGRPFVGRLRLSCRAAGQQRQKSHSGKEASPHQPVLLSFREQKASIRTRSSTRLWSSVDGDPNGHRSPMTKAAD